ncbi:Probable Succinate dehydrogenase, cytochrome b subunit [Flavobacterium indicum GPTSA100-9 = DSM 17447]|uniref:Probable Succinate dehydrogenase, cytochrome b subunit n=1 Tax=Flavobacterium indicum (strain DSM 17447 / CIP 109464 / GPTSA100-9) TaxID=1094466 RepID=H8XRZ6_FLAIG|nr:succinate dehydrogenase cytochrome b subunit [Flavobacterium indicum]CCG54580.1 Probable Succinate dehydrogenase, cytochrome b subunit [Flavobacterium indicum GPTSA100-9 = DSM 17447]
MAKSAFLKSSIAKKYWMALTGLFLCLFLVGHLLGNLQLLAGRSTEAALQFNKYALFMTSNPAVKVLSYLTYISILFHAIDGIALAIQNKKARPVNYAYKNDSVSSSFSSRNMAVLGTLVLVFIATHMVNFWAKMHFDKNMPLQTIAAENMGQKVEFFVSTNNGLAGNDAFLGKFIPTNAVDGKYYFVEGNSIYLNREFKDIHDGNKLKKEKIKIAEGYKDLHKITIEFFKSKGKLFGAIPNEGLLFTIFYVFSMAVLGFHLWHGFQSAFQSLGVNNKFTPAIQFFGKVFSVIVPLLFAIIPLYIHFILK